MIPLIPLEDSWNDVIRKARRGLNLSEATLAEKCRISAREITELEEGDLDEKLLQKVSTPLGLHWPSLLSLARKEYHPGFLELPEGMTRFTTPWSDFEVHSYLLWNSHSAVAFDTGSDASEMLDFLKQKELTLEAIFLTHGHGDHVFEVDRLMEKTGAIAWIGEREEALGAERFFAGKEFSLGSFRIETRSTWGHSDGGITYVIHGLDRPVAVVGDALFAGSMGGPMSCYQASLETNRKEIFTLPPDTLLCPGHGPLTTVSQEIHNNPFFD